MKKKIVYATMIMSTVALVSTGFAAWIISGNDNRTANGSIAVDSASDVSRMIESVEWKATNSFDTSLDTAPIITYGGPKEQNNPNAWIKDDSTGDVESENLEAYLQVKVKNTTSNEAISSVFETVTLECNKSNEYNAQVTVGTVGALPTYVATNAQGISIAHVATEGNVQTYNITIKFSWGAAFNYKNPYEYYNSMSYDEYLAGVAEGNVVEAVSTLNGLKDALNGATFTLTLKTAAKVI